MKLKTWGKELMNSSAATFATDEERTEQANTRNDELHKRSQREVVQPCVPDVLIVGAGLYGLTMAERIVTQLGKRVLLIDRRNHIGGNCASEIDSITGIECHKYGAHLFHTSIQSVWDYVNQFTSFTNYTHKVYTTHKGEVYPLPINLGTINQFFHSTYSPAEARAELASQAASAPAHPTNLAEQGVSLIGRPLFDAFIKNYTAKQWQTPAEELPAEVIKRLPVRYNYNNNYFNDTYEGLPVGGYNAWFQNIVASCGDKLEIRLDTDYFADPSIQELRNQNIFTIYTGPIDKFYDYRFDELKWRSVTFEKEVVNVDDYQGCPVMNYADLDQDYTRILEFKHFHPERHTGCYAENSGKTVIFREYSKTWTREDEPYYPVNTAEDQAKLAQYQKLAAAEPNVVFGGRLGEYTYYDMDKTIAAALDKFEEIKARIN